MRHKINKQFYNRTQFQVLNVEYKYKEFYGILQKKVGDLQFIPMNDKFAPMLVINVPGN